MKFLPKTGFLLIAATFAFAAHAQELTGTLKKIKDSGTIVARHARVVGRARLSRWVTASTSASTPRWARRSRRTSRSDLKMPKLDVKYQPVTSQNRIPLVQNGTVDLECGSTTNNAARQKDVAFAMTTYVEEGRIVVKANSPHQGHRRPERQDGRHDHRHHVGADAAQEQARGEHGLQGSVRQGPRRQLPAARIRPRRRVRDGRPDPRRPRVEVEEPGRLQDPRRGPDRRADRLHDAQGRPGVQEGGRRQHRRDGQERRAREDVRQVVHGSRSRRPTPRSVCRCRTPPRRRGTTRTTSRWKSTRCQ